LNRNEHPGAARSAPSAGPEATIASSKLRLVKADGTFLGYIKSAPTNIFGEYGITSDPSEALRVTAKYNSLLTVSPAEVKIVVSRLSEPLFLITDGAL
jgi:hypothetical protein